MAYSLGVDLGTTYTAAAIANGRRPELVTLGDRSAALPSVVLLREDETMLLGDAAERRGVLEASRTAREFKRRLGDPTPILLGRTPYGAEALLAHLLRHVLGRVVEEQGGIPERVLLTHPANYGPFKLDLLRETARLADVPDAEFLSEPQAAAVHYSQTERVAPGELIAVYDFGGGTFDAAVVRKTEDGFELVGDPQGIERLGGIDVDEAVFRHVVDAIGDSLQDLDSRQPSALAAVARLRDECRRAKEALSSDTDAAIPVMLPTLHTEVRLTREELEEMIRPRLRETIAALERAVLSGGVGFSDISRVLLVGGSSRIPLVAELVREATGRPIALDANPKSAVALGAAAHAADSRATEGVLQPAVVPSPPPTRDPPSPVRGGKRRLGLLLAAGLALAVGAVAAGGAVLVLSDKPSGVQAAPMTKQTTTERAPATTASAEAPTAEDVAGQTTTEAVPPEPTPSTEFDRFEGEYFSIEYPRDWVVDTAEELVGEGDDSYLDTTIREEPESATFIRVDVSPGSNHDPEASATQLEERLRTRPQYERIRFAPTSFAGYDGFYWEFRVAEDGVLLHKVDVLFVDDHGNSFAFLVQTEDADWVTLVPTYLRVINSFTAAS